MDPATIVSLLEPLREPPPPSWWPPAPGWWLLAALLLAGIYALGRTWRRRTSQRAPLRSAARQLAVLREQSPQQAARGIAELLRRVALRVDTRRDCARLSGRAWVDHLNALAGEALLPDTLADLAYRAAPDAAEVAGAADAVAAWLRRLETRRC
jgi:hypothetical protein